MNMFGVAGQIVARDKKGKSLLVTVRYGTPTQITDETFQLVSLTCVRIPMRSVEKIDPDDYEIGRFVSLQGYMQGNLQHDQLTKSATLSNELVGLNLVPMHMETTGDEVLLDVGNGQTRQHLMNIFGVVGKVASIEKAGNGDETHVTVLYGKPPERGIESVQFVNFARVTVPRSLMESHEGRNLEKGRMVSMEGGMQGVMHRGGDGKVSLVNEFYCRRIAHLQIAHERDKVLDAVETKGQGRYLTELYASGQQKAEA